MLNCPTEVCFLSKNNNEMDDVTDLFNVSWWDLVKATRPVKVCSAGPYCFLEISSMGKASRCVEHDSEPKSNKREHQLALV